MLQPGTQAPDFSAPDQNGNEFKLSKLIGSKNIVLYFYPKDETPGCTAEACSFRDQYEDFLEAGAEVVGVSGDSVNSHQKFAQNRRLPFILVSDQDRKVHTLYDVGKGILGLLSDRVTYVIDQKGIIRHAFKNQFNATKHVGEALSILKSL